MNGRLLVAMSDGETGSRTAFAKSLRQNMTDAENKLWYRLRANRLQHLKFRRQVPIGPYIVDFCSFGQKLVIEVDGGQHDEDRGKDAIRTKFLEQEGFRVMRFWNTDVLTNEDSVLQTIVSAAGSGDRN